MNFNIKDIAKTFKDSKKLGKPVIIFTGAGCSKSAGMPLASELVNEINKKFKGHLKSLNEEQKKDYGTCMSHLVPSEQKNLIEKHISKAKINWAHIALASLLKNGYLGKILTFNFDDILSRACSLDNFYPPTYDLKVLSEEYFSAIPNQSIVHLHGQWSGFQLANSDIDTGKQAEKLNTFIKNTINNSPTLFIGYSGGADAFFKLVEEGFIGQHRLFWIDYAKEPNFNVRKFIDANPNHRNFVGEQDADKFLLELAIELKCFPTELFKDPIKHLKGICQLVNPFPLPTSDTDIDILEDTKKTLEIADRTKPEIATIKLAELLHAKKFDAVINQAKNLDLTIKTTAKIVASAYLGKAKKYVTQGNSTYKIYLDKAIQIDNKFYQAYAVIAVSLAKQFENTGKDTDIIDSINYFEKAFEVNSHFKNKAVLSDYCSAYGLLAELKNDKKLFENVKQMYDVLINTYKDDANILGNYGLFLKMYAYFSEDINIFKNAIEQLKCSIEINPNDDNHLNNYALALAQYGIFESNIDLLIEAYNFFNRALALSPSNKNYLFNYSVTLLNHYQINGDESYLNLAKIKIEESQILINSSNPIVYNTYGVILFNLAKLENNKHLFLLAQDNLSKATLLKKKYAYNLAILYAYENKKDQAIKYLRTAEANNGLPTIEELTNESDLHNIQYEPLFIELLDRLKAKNVPLEKVS